MGDVGAVATLLNTLASWVLSPDGLADWSRRRALRAKKQEVLRALKQHDFDRLHRHIDELRALANKP
ncbi:MAG: hypothetical protein JSR31_05975 [Nitrospira sp.]|nr:hypothetical protein [Nitrospira sp.]